MKKPRKVHPLLSDAFVIWLTLIGYKAILSAGCIRFHCPVSNKNFPRDVMILENGRLNKPATQLFEEFKKHEPFKA
ncbi:hypothetical protein [Acinetobacter piscicola]|uniref:hypothetical protein n=1 Tax=Acinetobacter piscicola TaxID=2006115 RepID=UPI001020AEBA|nr:hypothetical protein [Acinetobacter piscicola]RYL25080.1 hypothetical protein EWP19_12905 [Acinetobacter piscicola]